MEWYTESIAINATLYVYTVATNNHIRMTNTTNTTNTPVPNSFCTKSVEMNHYPLIAFIYLILKMAGILTRHYHNYEQANTLKHHQNRDYSVISCNWYFSFFSRIEFS